MTYTQNFTLLPWQIEYLNWWQKLANADKLPQALLIEAPDGYGKFNLACKFAKLTFCKNPHQIDCTSCENCKLILSENYPDLLLLEPKGKNISIEQVRSLLDFVMQSGARTKRKVIILKDAHTLNINSANAMLKILEEPPEFTSFILTTSKAKFLPATILSRLQKLELHQPDKKITSQWLAQKGVDNPLAKLAENQNAPLLALNDSEDQKETKNIIMQTLASILAQQITPIEAATKIPTKLDLKASLEAMQFCINDFLRSQILATPSNYINAELFNALAQTSQMKKLLDFYLELNQAIARLNTNPNRQLLFEHIFIKFAQASL